MAYARTSDGTATRRLMDGSTITLPACAVYVCGYVDDTAPTGALWCAPEYCRFGCGDSFEVGDVNGHVPYMKDHFDAHRAAGDDIPDSSYAALGALQTLINGGATSLVEAWQADGECCATCAGEPR